MAKDELFSGESKNIEYKVVVPDKSEKYMKTVVAFANTQGGRLVIGIDDKTHQVVGVDNDSLFQAMDALTSDEQAIAAACPKVDVTIQYMGGEQQVILNGENVNGVIRKEEVGNMASATSVYPVVRTKLVELQRQLAAKENVIMDGRDIGTVVLPNANVKIYLTASSKVRAKRRFDELTAKGVSCDMDAIEKDIIERDYRDMHRETSPLKQADDAVLLDSSDLDIDGVVEEMKKIIKKAE